MRAWAIVNMLSVFTVSTAVARGRPRACSAPMMVSITHGHDDLQARLFRWGEEGRQGPDESSHRGFGGLLTLITLTFKANGVPNALIGAMQTACGLAGMTGALAGPRLLRRHRIGALFNGGVVVNTLCAAAMAFNHEPVAIISWLCLACLLLPPGMAGVQAYQLTITPNALQGRVAAATGFITLAASPLATLLAGALVGAAWPLAIAPFLGAIVLTGGIAVSSRSIRALGHLQGE